MDADDDELLLPPVTTNTFCIPNDPELLAAYDLYKTSLETRKLFSEQKREIFADAFIEDRRLGTLKDLCVQSLAKLGTWHISPLVKQDPLKLRIHYDSLSAELPLRDCYFVDDIRFWQRVVLTKSEDKSLTMKKLDAYDWKGKGVSLKFVELVEACEAEYWPAHLSQLAVLIKDHVRLLQIKHLKSLHDYSFEQYLKEKSEIDVTSTESEDDEISSDEPDTVDEEEEEEEVEEEEQEEKNITVPAVKKIILIETGEKRETSDERHTVFMDQIHEFPIETNDEADEETHRVASLYWDKDDERQKRRVARYARNAEKQALRDLQEKKHAEHERRKQHRNLLRQTVIEPVVKKKRGKKKNKSVFDIEVEPEPDDGEGKKIDGRNKEKFLDHLVNYDYPQEHCHHVDLSFVRFFDHLVEFHLEFLGPKMGRQYHKRHRNFSYDDMTRLARGLKNLQTLKIFRLRNSRMDVVKLQILIRALKHIESLEKVDFGYDQLPDTSGSAIAQLFHHENRIHSLELEYNQLGRNALDAICTAVSLSQQQNLKYLGLAHNPLTTAGLDAIRRLLLGTKQIESLNICGVDVPAVEAMYIIAKLLREHQPLRQLNMSAIPMSPTIGTHIIQALQANSTITHIDMRACGFEGIHLLEAATIMRRNKYLRQRESYEDPSKTDTELMAQLANRRHPIEQKIFQEMENEAECIRNRVDTESSSELSVEEVEEEKEYDIWAELGITVKKEEPTPLEEHISKYSIKPEEEVWPYDPNKFDLEKFQAHANTPNGLKRYYYFKRSWEN